MEENMEEGEPIEVQDRAPFILHDDDEDPVALKRELHLELAESSREPMPPGLSSATLDKVLKITSSFEGEGYGQVSGNFDGEGCSVGAIQQCIGQQSLQPLLREMLTNHRDVLVRLWSEPIVDDFERFMAMRKDEQVMWCSFNLGERERPTSRWAERLRIMAVSPEYVAIQQKFATAIFLRAVRLADSYQLVQENGLALMFDLCVQNGGIADKHRPTIATKIANKQAAKGAGLTEDEKLEQIAIGRISFSKPRWQADAFSRKICIVRRKTAPFTWNGQRFSGKVHGDTLDLEKQFGLTTKPFRS